MAIELLLCMAVALMLKATGKERVQWREVRNERDGSGNTITKYADHSDAVQFFKQNVCGPLAFFSLPPLARSNFAYLVLCLSPSSL